MAIDLTPYMPAPFEMTAGEWTITSPVPNVEVGKLITAFQAMQAEQARRATVGEEPLTDDTLPGFPDTIEDLCTLLLGRDQYQQLAAQGCPIIYLANAATAALVYWANGGSEEAVHAYNQAIMDARKQGEASPKATTRKPSKNGRPTA